MSRRAQLCDLNKTHVGIAQQTHAQVFIYNDHGWLRRPSAKGGDGACERNFGFRERSIVSYSSFTYSKMLPRKLATGRAKDARKEFWISAKRSFCYEGNIGQRPCGLMRGVEGSAFGIGLHDCHRRKESEEANVQRQMLKRFEASPETLQTKSLQSLTRVAILNKASDGAWGRGFAGGRGQQQFLPSEMANSEQFQKSRSSEPQTLLQRHGFLRCRRSPRTFAPKCKSCLAWA